MTKNKLGDGGLRGSDVLDVLTFIEGKSSDPNAQFTILSSAISLLAMHHRVRRRDLMRGVEAAFVQATKNAPNLARSSGATNDD